MFNVPLVRSSVFKVLAVLGATLALTLALSSCADDKKSGVTNNPVDTTGPQLLDITKYSPAQTCAVCHPDQVEQWQGSMHAYAAKDPVMAAINLAGQMAYVNAVDQGCVKCHSMLGSRAGLTPWGEYDVDNLPQVAQEGIGCDVCHMMESFNELQNGEINLTEEPIRYGTIRDPVPNAFHESEFKPFYGRSEYCGTCHDIDNGSGLMFEATFTEWQNGGFTVTGKTCNDCHMPAYIGRATPTSPERVLHDHKFIGTDLAFIDFPGKPEQQQLVQEMLQNSVTMTLNAPATVTPGADYSFSVDLLNDLTGHNVPSGATFLREVWLQVVVTDAAGDTVYASGLLDANDDLKDDDSEFPERDDDLFNLQSTMLRADSVKTWEPWVIAYLVDPTLRPGETRTANYTFTAPLGVTGPLQVDVALQYRTFPPHVLRGLDLGWMLPLPIMKMEEASQAVTVL
ncbi:MAG TPA: multiheme c-type cytochrome [candidate division Zixibacteria bacterium]|nr:multiheme c-type cytochrome [candidate division Zixibacteria bacterium]